MGPRAAKGVKLPAGGCFGCLWRLLEVEGRHQVCQPRIPRCERRQSVQALDELQIEVEVGGLIENVSPCFA